MVKFTRYATREMSSYSSQHQHDDHKNKSKSAWDRKDGLVVLSEYDWWLVWMWLLIIKSLY